MERIIYSVINGVVIPIEQVDDPVFAEKMLGDGIAVRPKAEKQTVVAPCDGIITTLNSSNHAITLKIDNKFDFLIHIGIDTVMLKGEGFRALVNTGDKVKQGQGLIEVDFNFLSKNAPSIDVISVLTNMDDNIKLIKTDKKEVSTSDAIFTICDKSSELKTPHDAPEQSDGEVISPVCVIYNEVGIHARPASILSQTASKFKSSINIRKGDKTVNAKSMISVMGLGVKYLDSVQITAKGEDAKEAVDTIVKAIANGLGEEVNIPSASAAKPQETNKSSVAAQVSSKAVHKNIITDFSSEVTLKGVVASPGLVIGHCMQHKVEDIPVEENSADIDKEKNIFEKAVNDISAKLQKDVDEAKKKNLKTRVEIFTAHMDIVKDEALLSDTRKYISDGKTAGYAWKKGIQNCVDVLRATNDPLLQERIADYKDIERRVLKSILGMQDEDEMNLKDGTIVIADDLVPSDMIRFGDKLAGVVLSEGSSTSHVSLIIRNMGTPALVAVGASVLNITDGTDLILDANEGILTVNPNPSKLKDIKVKEEELRKIKEKNISNALKPAITTDGETITVKGNISNSEQALAVSELGADGIGLFRTEFLFFNSRTAPEEDYQHGLYQDVVDAVKGGGAVTLRTLDVGGDKPLAYVEIEHEENPIMGLRGVRNYEGNKDIFLTQIRAILRIKPLNRVKIMIPMVADVFEIKWAKEVIEEEKKRMGITEKLQIGTMIEVPSAALIAEQIAKYVDFFSIGTNDLTQYTLAMDRGNAKLTARLNNLHPAVLKLIKATVEGGNIHKIPTAICGAMASEIRSIPILVGLGVKELSASMKSIPDVKALIREISYAKCCEVAKKALELSSADEVTNLVKKEFNL